MFHYRTFFEFNIEKSINLTQFLQYTDVDISNHKSILSFLTDNVLFTLDVVEVSMDEYSCEKEQMHQKWRESALNVLDEYQMIHLNDN